MGNESPFYNTVILPEKFRNKNFIAHAFQYSITMAAYFRRYTGQHL